MSEFCEIRVSCNSKIIPSRLARFWVRVPYNWPPGPGTLRLTTSTPRSATTIASAGRGQLQVPGEREIFETYRRALGNLPGIDFMPEAPWSRHNRWLTVITIDPEQFGATRPP